MRKILNFAKLIYLSFKIREIPFNIFLERIIMRKSFFNIKIGNTYEKIHWKYLVKYINSRRLGWVFYKEGNRWFTKNRRYNLMLSSKKLFKLVLATNENHEKHYKVFNFSGKNVIDIGGYIGETALLFKKWGANKVFVFEPLRENIEDMRYNVRLNRYEDHIKILPFAVGWNGAKEIKYAPETYEDLSFGLHEGSSSIILQGWSWNKVLKFAIDNDVDIIKVDCEGCEKYLTESCSNLIRRIKFWIIEAHTLEISKIISNYFLSLGYKIRKKKIGSNNSLIYVYNVSLK